MPNSSSKFGSRTAGTLDSVVASMGRTEDVALPPDGLLLAVAAFDESKVFVFSLDSQFVWDEGSSPLREYAIIAAPCLEQVHGVAFLDSDHVVCCCRGDGVFVFRVPAFNSSEYVSAASPVARIRGDGFLRAAVKSPGSVAVCRLGDDRYRILVCNDQWHFISSHLISLRGEVKIRNEGVLIEKGLRVPDGIAISPDERWIAVSNHVDGGALLFENTEKLNRRSEPIAALGGMVCPHGLDFDARGDLYVADAASPYLHYYAFPEGGWRDQSNPTRSMRVMDDETFNKGRYAPREGGVKGLKIDRERNLVITAYALSPLEFHQMDELVSGEQPDVRQLEDLRRDRDADVAERKATVLQRKWSIYWRLRSVITPLKSSLYKGILKFR